MAVIIMVIWAVANSGVLNSCNSPQAEPVLVEESGEKLPEDDTSNDENIDVSEEAYARSNEIVVYVCGQVVKPGVYKLAEGSRLYEAVNLAGGLRKGANPTAINMAAPITDGDMIYIPARDEQVSMTGTSVVPSIGDNGSNLVNINTASTAQLETLTGIGPAKAEAIARYRETSGSFSKKEDIMKVSGIGQGTYDRIKDEITL